MGGLLFKTKRLPKEDYLIIQDEITSILDSNRVKYFIPFYFADKQDFGDLDIIILDGVSNDYIRHLFNTSEDSLNDKCFSIKHKDFQIDFIKVGLENWESSKNYYSYNDLGNLIGRLAQRHGLSFGDKGLFHKYRTDAINANISVSKDMKKILEFLDLDYTKYSYGFNTIEEIFDFIIKSKYFNPWMYDLSQLNKINRDRNKKRKTYAKWLEYIEDLKKDYESLDFKTIIKLTDDKIETIEKFFNADFKGDVERLTIENERLMVVKEKFNGVLVMKHIPLSGAELGKFISKFDKYILETEMISRNDYVYSNDDIIEKMLKFYDSYENW